MKYWKKIATGILSLLLLLCLCSCGGTTARSNAAVAESTAVVTQEIVATQAPVATPVPTQAPVSPVPAATEAATAEPEATAEEDIVLLQPTCMDAPYDYQYVDMDKQIVIRRFQENGITYFIADVQLTNALQFQTALSSDQPSGRLETISEMARRNGAVLAINADDYGVHKYGTIIRNGELIRTHDTTRNMLIVDANGDFSVRVNRKNEKPKQLGDQLMAQNVWQTFEFGPELIRDGKAVTFSKDFDVISTSANRREPRTAIGQIGPLHYVIIVADGRQDGYSKGMTLGELQDLFISCGAQTAMNLDGGGSTEMWFNGMVINQPAGGTERRLSDMLFF